MPPRGQQRPEPHPTNDTGSETRNHLATSSACNNNCAHCMERDPAGRLLVPLAGGRALTVRELERMIKQGLLRPGAPVVFTGGEPTLNPALPRLAALLKRRGFGPISIQTNGRLLCYRDFCLRLIKAGVTGFSVSIHGSTAAQHEALTRTRGSFAQTLRGLENLLDLKTRLPQLRIAASVALARTNLDGLGDILDFLARAHTGLDTIVLNPLVPQGNAALYAGQLLVPYTVIAAAFIKAMTRFKGQGPGMPQVSLTDFPRCVGTGLEAYIGTFEKVFLVDPAREARELDAKLGFPGIKRDRCGSCLYFSSCTGIAPAYINRFGWKEFSPFRPAGLRAVKGAAPLRRAAPGIPARPRRNRPKPRI